MWCVFVGHYWLIICELLLMLAFSQTQFEMFQALPDDTLYWAAPVQKLKCTLAEAQGYHRFLLFEPEVGQNIALYASLEIKYRSYRFDENDPFSRSYEGLKSNTKVYFPILNASQLSICSYCFPWKYMWCFNRDPAWTCITWCMGTHSTVSFI